MKKFIRYCALFVLPILIAALPVEYLIRQVPNPYKYKYEWMQRNAEDVEILVLGSSHTFFGIRPEFFDGKAFSLANVSQGNRQDYFLLNYWAERYKKLKTVIVPISFFSWFGQGLEYGSESYRCRYYKMYMDCDLYSDWSLYNLELSDIRTAMEKVGKIIHKDDDLGYDKFGWGDTFKLVKKNMAKWNDGTEAEAAVKRHTVKNWDYIETNYERMKEMAEFCNNNHHIQLVLITTPCWHSYYDNLNKEQLSKMYELTHRFQKEFDVPYLDYLKDPRFKADDFYDSNHLSDIGAIKFTKILNKDIKSFK